MGCCSSKDGAAVAPEETTTRVLSEGERRERQAAALLDLGSKTKDTRTARERQMVEEEKPAEENKAEERKRDDTEPAHSSLPRLLDGTRRRRRRYLRRLWGTISPVGGGPAGDEKPRGLTTIEEKFPMHLISMRNLLSLKSMLSHQELLRRKVLVRMSPDLAGRVIFVSHQWVARTHPDPNGDQLACLQRVLWRMLTGEIPRVDVQCRHRVGPGSSSFITSREMRESVQYMYLWIDWMCVPQLAAGPMPYYQAPRANFEKDVRAMDEQLAAEGLSATEWRGAIRGKGGKQGRVQVDDEVVRLWPANDHRPRARVLRIHQMAVESLPAYLEQSAVMLVLAPPCTPATASSDRTGQETPGWQSWHSRGFCRLEGLMAGPLAFNDLHIMAVRGPERQPEFICPPDVWQCPPGLGDFTCCSKGHLMNCGPIKCDKRLLAATLRATIDAKVDALFRAPRGGTRSWFAGRALWCLGRGWLMRGLADERAMGASRRAKGGGCNAPASELCGLPSLLLGLRWRGKDSTERRVERAFCRRTGTSLLFWAVMANDTNSVREILLRTGTRGRQRRRQRRRRQGSNRDGDDYLEDGGSEQPYLTDDRNIENKRGLLPISLSTNRTTLLCQQLRSKSPGHRLVTRCGLLHVAMLYADWDVVTFLLECGARAKATDRHGQDPLMWAAAAGRVDNMKGWLQRHTDWPLERVDKEGSTALSLAARCSPNNKGEGTCCHAVEYLINLWAHTGHVTDSGLTLLHGAAMNRHDAGATVVKHLLAIPDVRATKDQAVVPQTRGLGKFFKFLRCPPPPSSTEAVDGPTRDQQSEDMMGPDWMGQRGNPYLVGRIVVGSKAAARYTARSATALRLAAAEGNVDAVRALRIAGALSGGQGPGGRHRAALSLSAHKVAAQVFGGVLPRELARALCTAQAPRHLHVQQLTTAAKTAATTPRAGAMRDFKL